MTDAFKLTYSTMFDPPPELHARFEAALAAIRPHLDAEHPMLIGGRDERAPRQFSVASPIDTRIVLGRFQAGEDLHARAAVAAAAAAFPAWAATKWQERVRILRRAVELIEARVYFIGAVLALEVGKNRMEALGEAQETADLIAYYCAQMEANDGYATPMAADPLPGFVSENQSVLRPYGPWLVIAPFNFLSRWRAAPRARRWSRATPSCSRRRRRRPGAGACWRTRSATRACRPGVQLRHRAGRVHRRGADPASRRGRRHVHGQL